MAFDRDRGNRGRSFGGPRSFDRPREMTKVTCSNCGKETEVPFKPTGDRPVYCKECFAKMGHRDSARPPFRKFEDRSKGPSQNSQLSEINAKLDTLIELLSPKEKVTKVPTVEKPVVEKPTKEKKVVKAKKALKIVSDETPTEE